MTYSVVIEFVVDSNGFFKSLFDLGALRKKYFFDFALLLLHIIIIIPALLLLVKKLHWDIISVIRSIIKLSIFQSIISTCMFFVLPFKDIIFKSVVNMEHYFPGQNELFEAFMYLRLNGIGSELTFGFSLFQGFSLVLLLAYNNHNKTKLIYFIPIIILSIIVNARIGLVLPLVYLLFNINSILKFKFSLKAFTILFFIFTLIANLIISYPEIYENIETILIAGFDDENILPHQNTLTGSHLFLPDTLFGWIFGYGSYIFANDKSLIHSDIGYVNIIFFGGVIFQLLLFYLYFIFFGKKSFREKMGAFSSNIISVLVISFLLVQFKGNVFGVNGFTKATFLFYLFIIFSKNNYEKSKLSSIKI